MTATRRDVRKRLAMLMSARSEFTAVYDHAKLDLRGQDRVLEIYNDQTRHEMLSKHLNNGFYRFTLDTYALRRVDEAGAEDALDEMHEAIRAVIRENVGDATWDELSLAEDSDALFAKIANEPYRIERHSLSVKVMDAA
jgi:hypothetical protein